MAAVLTPLADGARQAKNLRPRLMDDDCPNESAKGADTGGGDPGEEEEDEDEEEELIAVGCRACMARIWFFLVARAILVRAAGMGGGILPPEVWLPKGRYPRDEDDKVEAIVDKVRRWWSWATEWRGGRA